MLGITPLEMNNNSESQGKLMMSVTQILAAIGLLLCMLVAPKSVCGQGSKTAADEDQALVSALTASLNNKEYSKALDILRRLQVNIQAHRDGSPDKKLTTISQAKIAFVVNKERPRAVAFLQLLKQLNITPTLFDEIPESADLERFDLLMIFPVNTVTPADAKRVELYLKNGHGVVMAERAPLYLSTNDLEVVSPNGNETERDHNLTPISSWFGGVEAMHWVSLELHTKKSAGSFVLPNTVTPDELVANSGDQIFVLLSKDIRNPVVQKVIAGNGYYSGDFSAAAAIAYENPTGGRVYWQYSPYSVTDQHPDKILGLFVAGMTWAAHLKRAK